MSVGVYRTTRRRNLADLFVLSASFLLRVAGCGGSSNAPEEEAAAEDGPTAEVVAAAERSWWKRLLEGG